MKGFAGRRLARAVAVGAGVVLVAALMATVTANAAFADSVVDGCTIVSSPTPTHFTSCPGANLARADLSGLNLGYADLAGANLYQADLSGTTLSACSFQMEPPNVSCAGTRLGGAFLVGANLEGAATSTCVSLDFGDGIGVVPYCGGVDLSNTNLHNADLNGDNLSYALLTSSNLTRAKLRGTLFGQCASASKVELMDCSGADLSGAKLARTDLSGDVLTGANLTGADLRAANLSGANLSLLLPDFGVLPTILDKADLRGAVLRGANLSGASLKGARLAHAHVAGADLTDADLTNANLTDARLIGAHLAGATLTGIIWSHTTCPDGTNSNHDGNTCVGHL
jgi:uncharacterized protein YjbI with pentapeptide repeats